MATRSVKFPARSSVLSDRRDNIGTDLQSTLEARTHVIQEITASLCMGQAGHETACIIGLKLDIFGIGTWIYGIWDKTCPACVSYKKACGEA